MIQPGTVAAIAASLMAQGMNLGENSDLWPRASRFRESYINDYVSLAWDIAEEAERQGKERQPQPTAKRKENT